MYVWGSKRDSPFSNPIRFSFSQKVIFSFSILGDGDEENVEAADDAAKTEKNGASWSMKDRLFSIFRRKSTSQFHSEHYQ